MLPLDSLSRQSVDADHYGAAIGIARVRILSLDVEEAKEEMFDSSEIELISLIRAGARERSNLRLSLQL